MLRTLFHILASVISLYSLLCFIRIILTWIPSLAYSKVGHILASLCDPYLNLFRGIRWLRLGSFDLSPAVGLCLLGLFGFIFSGLANAQVITVGLIASLAVSLLWNIVHSLLILVILIMAIRLIAIFVQKTEYSGGIFSQLDASIGPLVSRISHTFTGGRRIAYKWQLVTGIVVFFVIDLVGNIVFTFLAQKIAMLPF